MNCPVCHNPMLVMELQQIEIDHCIECGGIWLDEGELELLLEDSNEKKQLLDSFSIDENNHEKKRRCPVCSKKMEKVFAGTDKKILIDKCKKNHGIWFDEGELHQIIEIGSLNKNNKVTQLLNEMFEFKLKKQKIGG